MSHPIPGHTYEEDILGQWSADELDKLWQLYREHCEQRGEKPEPRYFTVWLEENYL